MMMTTTLKSFRNEHGFTLAELLVACAIVGLVLAGMFIALQQGEDAYLYGAGKVEVQGNGRAAVDRLARDLRTASNITAATQTSISFQYIDEAGATITVTYSLNGTKLQRNQTNPLPAAAQPEIIIGGVNTLDLRYYASGHTLTTTVANIRVIDIRLITQSETTGLGAYNLANQQATFEDRVRPRNL
jgi:prepilin-type N-terminal cleavage/methylation domain-containing protein